jgi:chromosome condensin MukBEF complex kleisin-like MukF subunit
MIGNKDNINWLGGSYDSYLTVNYEQDRKVKIYFTANLLKEINSKFDNVFDKNNGKLHIMIGFDKDSEKLVCAICDAPNEYSTMFTLKKKNDKYGGKPKKITAPDLKDYLDNISDEGKFKLPEFELDMKDDKIFIEFYLGKRTSY